MRGDCQGGIIYPNSKLGEISTTFEAKQTKSARNMEIDSGESREVAPETNCFAPFGKWVRAAQGTSCGYNRCWTFPNSSHLLCGLCQLRWYWASMPALENVTMLALPKIAFRLPSEAGAHAQLAHAVVKRIDC